MTRDILHLNDVEVFGEGLADQYPLFEAGDLAISLKNLNLIAVVSQEREIKWLSSGDFTLQHDPDFEEEGWIVVFDNRSGLPDLDPEIGASRIRAINPAGGEIRDVYPADGQYRFFTNVAGKHQKLQNGNRLVTEALAARVFEISPEGETVWEWISEGADEDSVPEVLEGTRYDIDAQQVTDWKCSSLP